MADEVSDGTASGSLMLTESNDITGTLDIDYFYSDDLIFNRDVDRPTGIGYAVDIALNWQPADRFGVELSVNDAFSGIRWTDAPRTIANADSAIIETGEDGLLDVRPIIQGQNSAEDFWQRYDQRTTVAGYYQPSKNWALKQDIISIRETVLAHSSIEYAVNTHVSLSLHHEWTTVGVWRRPESGAFGSDPHRRQH